MGKSVNQQNAPPPTPTPDILHIGGFRDWLACRTNCLLLSVGCRFTTLTRQFSRETSGSIIDQVAKKVITGEDTSSFPCFHILLANAFSLSQLNSTNDVEHCILMKPCIWYYEWTVLKITELLPWDPYIPEQTRTGLCTDSLRCGRMWAVP